MLYIRLIGRAESGVCAEPCGPYYPQYIVNMDSSKVATLSEAPRMERSRMVIDLTSDPGEEEQGWCDERFAMLTNPYSYPEPEPAEGQVAIIWKLVAGVHRRVDCLAGEDLRALRQRVADCLDLPAAGLTLFKDRIVVDEQEEEDFMTEAGEVPLNLEDSVTRHMDGSHLILVGLATGNWHIIRSRVISLRVHALDWGLPEGQADWILQLPPWATTLTAHERVATRLGVQWNQLFLLSENLPILNMEAHLVGISSLTIVKRESYMRRHARGEDRWIPVTWRMIEDDEDMEKHQSTFLLPSGTRMSVAHEMIAESLEEEVSALRFLDCGLRTPGNVKIMTATDLDVVRERSGGGPA